MSGHEKGSFEWEVEGNNRKLVKGSATEVVLGNLNEMTAGAYTDLKGGVIVEVELGGKLQLEAVASLKISFEPSFFHTTHKEFHVKYGKFSVESEETVVEKEVQGIVDKMAFVKKDEILADLQSARAVVSKEIADSRETMGSLETLIAQLNGQAIEQANLSAESTDEAVMRSAVSTLNRRLAEIDVLEKQVEDIQTEISNKQGMLQMGEMLVLP